MDNKTLSMSSKMLLSSLAIIWSGLLSVNAQQTGTDLVKNMYARYAGKWHHSLSFTQRTEFYSNDSLKGNQTWYESIVFPDQFRIDFGSKDSGNAVIFKGDSSYSFKKGKLQAVRLNNSDLLFLLGGLYFYPLDQTLQKLKTLGYDLDKIHPDHWKGKAVWVLGDSGTGKKANQLWIDAENLFLVRMIEFTGNRKEEGLFDSHIFIAGGWTETKASFYFNDRLAQVETYRDCVANKIPDPHIFDPAHFVNPE